MTGSCLISKTIGRLYTHLEVGELKMKLDMGDKILCFWFGDDGNKYTEYFYFFEGDVSVIRSDDNIDLEEN